jgi:hypothetical protein
LFQGRPVAISEGAAGQVCAIGQLSAAGPLTIVRVANVAALQLTIVMMQIPINTGVEGCGSRGLDDRPAKTLRERREQMLDQTIADSFPASDPLSTIPDPSGSGA